LKGTRLASPADLYHLSAVTLLLAARWLPSEAARESVARTLGGVAYTTRPRKRRLVEDAVARALADRPWPPRVVRESFDDFWREMLAWTAPPDGPGRIEGRDHLDRALADGRGAILWESSGFGRRLRAKQILHAAGYAVHQIHGETHVGGFFSGSEVPTRLRELLKRFFDDLERRFVAEIIYLPVPSAESLAFTRGLLERLGRNRILCVSAEGRSGQRTVPLRFLGQTIPFSSGMVSLAKVSGAPLLPIFCAASEPLVIEAPIRVDPAAERDDALRQALGRYTALLEAWVRRQPELYRSWHTPAAIAEAR